MANRLKEDEKNERIIRGLAKLPANRKCINCSSLGPQYVCTNFSTFICTNCSGIHREFSHRVKSISMAKFTSQEVNALQQAGNERAKEIFFKEWDPQRHSFPDSSNVEKLRTFIKHVYVDRRYASEKDIDKHPRSKGDREEPVQKRQDASAGGSRSPSYNESYDRRYSERPSTGGRNDDHGFRSSFEERSEYMRSPVNDRYRDEKSGTVQKYQGFEGHKIPDGMQKPESGSPNQQKDVIASPVLRLARDASKESTPAVKIAEPPKSNGRTADNVPAQTIATTSNLASVNGKIAETKVPSEESLIDFSTDIGPPGSYSESVPQTLPANGGNWASFDSISEQKAAQATATMNPLDPTLGFHSASGNAPASNATFPAVVAPSPLQTTFTTGQQNVPPLFPTSLNQSAISSITPSIVGDTRNQSWIPSVQNIPRTMNASEVLVPQNTKASNAQQTAELSIPESAATKNSGRKELPADLFAALYPQAYAPVMGWQPHPNNFAPGYGMQYPMAVAQPAFSYLSKPANPFDTTNASTLTHASTFPSLTSLQGALPDSVNSGLMRASSLGGNPTQQYFPQSQPQPPSAFSAVGGFMGQPQQNIPQPSNYMFSGGNQVNVDITGQRVAFGHPGIMQQQPNSQYPQSGTPNAFASVGGNPFG